MSRSLLAIAAVAIVGATAPAAAMSFQVNLPNLTYPPVAAPETTQGCADMTTLSDVTCTAPSK